MKPDKIDYVNLCNEILGLSKKIRYVGIFYNNFSVGQMREGLTSLLTHEETVRSLKDALTRWKTRESLSNKLGKPHYAMTEYDKVKRITIPLPEDGILLVSTEPTMYHELIAKEIIEIIDRHSPIFRKGG